MGTLRESQQRLQAILDNASLLVSVKDLDGRLTLADAHRENDLVAIATRDASVEKRTSNSLQCPDSLLESKFFVTSTALRHLTQYRY
jgi:hypothetical protein